MKTPIILIGLAAATLAGAHAQFQGPSSSQTSYLDSLSGWNSTAILTTGDSVGGYRMVGIPDGLGAWDNGDGTVSVLMNHELSNTVGTIRSHGSIGAFVSLWTVDKNTLQVTSGRDFLQSPNDVFTWNGSGYTPGTTVFNRLCSADLAAPGAFFSGGLGYDGRIFLTGEEKGAEGRAFAFIATGSDAGKAYELPHLGRISWENAVANPFSGTKTVVAGNDDSTPGQVYIYQGTKSATGSAVERAGLAGGSLAGIKVVDGGANYGGGAVTVENNGAINGHFVLAGVPTDVSNTATAGTLQQTSSVAAGVTEFARPEDGQWLNRSTYLFVTTGANPGGNATFQSSKLYRLDFTDPDNLELGGTISMVLDRASLAPTAPGSTAMFDNITVGADGKVYIQEDPGNNAYIARIWQVDLSDPLAAVALFQSDTDRFLTGGPNFQTIDEEHSGIIDVTSLFADASWYKDGQQLFLGDTQNHLFVGGELVEGGQLWIASNKAIPEPSTFALLALAGTTLMVARRRRS